MEIGTQSSSTRSRIAGDLPSKPVALASRPLVAHLVLLLLVLVPASGAAREMRWRGTLDADLAAFAPLRIEGSGVATLSPATGGLPLESLRLAGGITGSGMLPITDPDATGTYQSIRLSASLGAGTLSPFWPISPWPEPQLERNTLPIRGLLRVCMFGSGCSGGFASPLSESAGARAVGVGGALTVGGYGGLRVSIEAAPWTVYSATLRVATVLGGSTLWQRTGWIHGPDSFSSSAATTGGGLQLVTPLLVRSNGDFYLPGFASLTLGFIPEAGALMSIVAGVLGLIGVHRVDQHRSRRNKGKSR